MNITDWLDAEGTKEAHAARDLIESLRAELEAVKKERDEAYCDVEEADRRLAACQKERDGLLAALIECRSSVKFDLNRYERMALDYSRLGPEGEAKHAIAEGEATRLHKLIDTIDDLEKHAAMEGK